MLIKMHATAAILAVMIANTEAAKLSTNFPTIPIDSLDPVDLSQVANTYEIDYENGVSHLLTQNNAALWSEAALLSDAELQGMFDFIKETGLAIAAAVKGVAGYIGEKITQVSNLYEIGKLLYQQQTSKRELTLDDVVTLTNGIPVFGSVVSSIQAGRKLGTRATRLSADKEACYRRNWNFQVTGTKNCRKVDGKEQSRVFWKFCSHKCDNDALGVQRDFIECGIFCATKAYCTSLKDTVLANFINAGVQIASVVGGDYLAIFELINKILQLAEQMYHPSCTNLTDDKSMTAEMNEAKQKGEVVQQRNAGNKLPDTGKQNPGIDFSKSDFNAPGSPDFLASNAAIGQEAIDSGKLPVPEDRPVGVVPQEKVEFMEEMAGIIAQEQEGWAARKLRQLEEAKANGNILDAIKND